MVFAGLFPTDSDDYPELRDALEKLKLNDARALLRARDVAGARLRLPLRLPRPAAHGDRARAARARVRPRPARDRAERRLPRARPERRRTGSRCTSRPTCRTRSSEVEEPYIKASVIVPKEYVGTVMELCNERRGSFDHMEYLSEERVHLIYELPLGRDRARLLRPAEVAHARLRELRLRHRRLPAGQARARRRARRRRAGRRALADHPPRVRLRPRQAARRAAAEGDPAPVLRRRRSRPRSAPGSSPARP